MSESSQISPWSYKPWWCQPWSILLTGITIITGSWLLAHTVWFACLVAVPILTWMGFFILVWPQLVIRSGILEAESSSVESAIAEE
ncbi:DUF6737 family protein [Trichocoleus sp. FACHB-262]|uniref:DUF6737 family protein n=1 Tax=Trichocoleus sp. FACHB-262 TaxID=2692869 RepID=UPI0016824DEF|nr:DUF6737 family protein [Trichocoleus sp. FACHB-262]MBD2121435.1 hypothetical protein [Trichocoleus sp. FACHB-262]